jgi:SAM-dependent methyltransferase
MWHFPRKKPRNFITAVLYRFGKLPFASERKKFRIFSDLAWILNRMALETSGKLIDRAELPSVQASRDFIKKWIKPSDTVLDLGCGDGHMSSFISNFCCHVVGIDYNPALIEVAQQVNTNSNVEFICADALSYLKASDTHYYDVMICSHILEHLDDPVKFIEDFRSHIKNIYIEVPDNDQHIVNHCRDILKFPINYSDADHIWEFKRDDVFKMVERLRCRILESEFSFGAMRFWLEL